MMILVCVEDGVVKKSAIQRLSEGYHVLCGETHSFHNQRAISLAYRGLYG